MRYWLAGTLALLTASFAVVSPASAGIDEEYRKPDDKKSWGELLVDFVGHPGFGKSYALVVGISNFDDFSSLPTANDPLRMRDFLIDEAGFDYVHVLTDDKATKARIDELMVDVLPGMIHANDQFLFYWSGHGTQRPNALGGQLGYLPLASSAKDRYATMISMGDIQRWDEVLAARQALFLLDACFSGLAGSASKSDGRELQIDQLDKPAHHLVSAGTAEEQTIASDRWGGSIFTDAVLRAMRGEADAETSYPRDGVVSLSELIGYVKTRVAIEAPAAGWTKPITPLPHDLRPNTGEFFFLTSERKLAKLEGAGAQYQGRFEHGMPVVTMGAVEEVPEIRDPYGGRDVAVFGIINDSDIAKDFETFLEDYPASAFAPYARNRLALLRQRETVTPPPSVTARVDPTTLEAGLSLRPEDRLVVQEALTALGFDTQGTDGVFGANTRRAIIGWQRGQGDDPTGYLTPSQYGSLLAEAEPKLAALESARQKPEQASPVQPAVGVYEQSRKPGDEFRDCEQCPQMVVVPAGSFTMGSPKGEEGRDDDEGPHDVTIAAPFAVGQYEVTFDEWDFCVKGGGCRGYEPDDRGWGRGRRPVINVSWKDAQAYVEWLRKATGQPYRLLSEAEWEYAARAGTTTPFWTGSMISTAQANYNGNYTYGDGKKGEYRAQTTPVDEFDPNPWGLHDMHGNVWEWVEDCWNSTYSGAPQDGSAWLQGNCSWRVLRGGSWYFAPVLLRSANRFWGSTDIRSFVGGFRVARTLP